jgi:hypothetical protein
MSQIERGGSNLGRWPADIGNVSDDRDAAIEAVGDEDAERLSALPDHEIDTDTSVGAGLTASGGVAEDRGVEATAGADAELRQGERNDASTGDDESEDVGVPLGGDDTDR